VQLTTAVDIGTQTDLTLDSDLPVVSDDVTVVSEDQQNLLQNLMSRYVIYLSRPCVICFALKSFFLPSGHILCAQDTFLDIRASLLTSGHPI